jgi:signal transduction histidine kinase
MNSLRRQLTRHLLGATLLLLGGGLAAMFFAARDAAIDQFDFALRAKALALSTLTFATDDGVRVEFSDRFFRGFEDRKPRDFFELWSTMGQPIARSESLTRARELPRRAGTTTQPAYWNFNLPSGRPARAIGFVFHPKLRAGATPAAATDVQLVVATDRDELDDTLWQLVGLAAGCAVLLVVATLWIVPRVLRRGLQPLGQLGEQAAAIDARSLATRFDSAALPTELQPIARRLNDLLARLEASFERERRYSADLAHELRTPLAELRSAAECALKWPESREPSTDRDTLAIAQQMERLVGHLLALARSEHGQQGLVLETVPLEPLVRDVWRAFADRAAERRLAVAVSLVPTQAPADTALLRSILANLFDNAVDYAPTGGAVTIAVGEAGGRPAIVVANDAPTFTRSDLPHLFDRFWRKEAARTGGQHVGLGLSLARSFAEAMGWTLTAALDGSRLTFTLGPAAAGPQPNSAS